MLVTVNARWEKWAGQQPDASLDAAGVTLAAAPASPLVKEGVHAELLVRGVDGETRSHTIRLTLRLHPFLRRHCQVGNIRRPRVSKVNWTRVDNFYGIPRVIAERKAIAVILTEKLVPINTMRLASAIHRSAVPIR